jgi:DNA topoisomerase VI subunit B
MVDKGNNTKLNRMTLTTSRMMDFCTEKELTAQTGHAPADWPLVILKELVDNALDACEEGGIAPELDIEVTKNGIRVADNGPGIPPKTIEKILDFKVRVSSREAYVAPDRGAQGNALKTVLLMPFVVDGDVGQVEIRARGIHHIIKVKVDSIRQTPIVDHQQENTHQIVKNGCSVRVTWPDSASSILTNAKFRFLQMADDYTFLNPHLALNLEWMDTQSRIEAIDVGWPKWRPSEPTSAHWYELEHFERLIGAYIAYDEDRGDDRTVREVIAEFRGLSGSAKQKKVLQETGLPRMPLSALVNDNGAIDRRKLKCLLAAMQGHTKPVKAKSLGVIGKNNVARKFAQLGCDMESFGYRKIVGENDQGLPFIIETAFGWCEKLLERRLVTGINWSPGIINPFRELGGFGQSLDSILEQQRVGREEPVVFMLHGVHPRVEYTDRGKSAVVVRGGRDEQ